MRTTRETPDGRVVISQQPPGKGPGEGEVRYPLGGDRHPGAPDPRQPDTRPLPRAPDEHVRGR
jgi:hypothetical protein